LTRWRGISDGYNKRRVDAQAAGVCDYLDGGLPVLLYLQGLRRERENGDGNDVPFDHVLSLVFCILVGVSDGNR